MRPTKTLFFSQICAIFSHTTNWGRGIARKRVHIKTCIPHLNPEKCDRARSSALECLYTRWE